MAERMTRLCPRCGRVGVAWYDLNLRCWDIVWQSTTKRPYHDIGSFSNDNELHPESSLGCGFDTGSR